MDDITTLDVREAQPTNQLCVGCQVSLRKGTLTYSPQCSTRPSTASAGAARSSSIGARPTRRPFVHTGHDDGAVEGGPAHPVQHRPDTLFGPSHGHVANRVSGGGADRLVELFGQGGVR